MLTLTPARAALAIAALAFATIAGAWIFEYAGYAPCDLCLKQRWAYYAGVPLALSAAVAAARAPASTLSKILLAALALVFVGSAIFGAFHAGVEWGFWPGPTGCTGAIPARAANTADFMKQLQTVKVVRCDEVALRIFGLSLAGWNAILSACMSAMAIIGLRAR